MTRLLLLAGIIGSILAFGGSARAISTSLVISEVYGGGGNAGAPFTNDFVELRNIGTTPIALDGWSLQYASASGSTWTLTALPNVMLDPGKYFLVQEASGGANGAPLPTPDAVGAIGMGSAAGKVALVSSTAPLTGSCPAGSSDLVGYGTANCFEGTGAAPAPSNALSDQRKGGGRAETDDNAADFEALAPAPQNTTSPTAVTLRSFTATRAGGDVVLRWRTGAEVGTLGFNVFRELGLRRVKLNAHLIGASGRIAGHPYRYRASAAPASERAIYRLQVVEPGGRRSWVGSARVGAG